MACNRRRSHTACQTVMERPSMWPANMQAGSNIVHTLQSTLACNST